MKSTFVRAVLALTLALAGGTSCLQAQTPVLVKDIWPGASGSRYDPREPSSAGTAAGRAYVGGGFSFHGLGCGGMWVTDGTAPLRQLVDGLCVSGRGAELNGSLVFAASDSARGALWRSDGTTAGTSLVKRLGGGSPSIPGLARLLTAAGGKVFFSLDDGIHGSELWASDGTEAGTAMVVDATPGPGGTMDSFSTIVASGGGVFFTTCTPACALWKSDGTAAGTLPLVNLMASSLATIGTTLYFTEIGQNLWKSDGTPAGTVKFADVANVAELTAVDNTLFFRACDPTNGCELWKSDGTGPGTALVKDVTPGPGGDARYFTPFGNDLLFLAGASSSLVLWRSDGTDAGTIPLAPVSGQPASSAVAGGTYFLLTDAHLYASNASAAGTQVILDVPAPPAAGVVFGFGLTALGGVVVFGLGDAVGPGAYRSDGSAAGTRPLGPVVVASNSALPGRLTDANGTLFFGADDGVHGFELWATDGTPGGTRLVKDINPGPDGSNASRLVLAGGRGFFTAYTAAAGLELWQTDGTEAGTVLVKDIAPGTASSVPQIFGTRGDVVLFNASTDDNGVPFLWRSDGADAGTFSLGGVRGWSNVVDWRGASYFLGSYQGVYALWRTDGTEGGTSAVAAVPGDSWGGIAVAHDTLVFSTCDVAHGCELWTSDGTPAGTGLLFDVNPGAASGTGQVFLPVGDVAMFWADDGVHGLEPWVTDGTVAGTHLLADIFPGPASSAGNGTAAVGRLRFFAANDGVHGYELWKTDGTPQGTTLVADINPGPAGAFSVSSFTPGFRDVWFFATDGVTGEELWRSDGTANGTQRAADVFPGPGSSTIHPIISGFDRVRRSGSRMYFVADDGTTGFELWSVPLPTEMHVLAPCRLLDTRAGGGLPVADGEVRGFAAAGACGIPPGAGQVVANVTLVDPTADGSVEVGPGSPTWTGLAAVNAPKGRTRANNAILALATDGSASANVTAPGGAAHLVVDVTGYFQ